MKISLIQQALALAASKLQTQIWVSYQYMDKLPSQPVPFLGIDLKKQHALQFKEGVWLTSSSFKLGIHLLKNVLIGKQQLQKNSVQILDFDCLKLKTNIKSDRELIVFIINHQDKHWHTAGVYPSEGKIKILNSLESMHNVQNVKRRVSQFLQHNNYRFQKLNIQIMKVDQQPNCNDCGLFSIRNAFLLAYMHIHQADYQQANSLIQNGFHFRRILYHIFQWSKLFNQSELPQLRQLSLSIAYSTKWSALVMQNILTPEKIMDHFNIQIIRKNIELQQKQINLQTAVHEQKILNQQLSLEKERNKSLIQKFKAIQEGHYKQLSKQKELKRQFESKLQSTKQQLNQTKKIANTADILNKRKITLMSTVQILQRQNKYHVEKFLSTEKPRVID